MNKKPTERMEGQEGKKVSPRDRGPGGAIEGDESDRQGGGTETWKTEKMSDEGESKICNAIERKSLRGINMRERERERERRQAKVHTEVYQQRR
jgi:hypothetical protein